MRAVKRTGHAKGATSCRCLASELVDFSEQFDGMSRPHPFHECTLSCYSVGLACLFPRCFRSLVSPAHPFYKSNPATTEGLLLCFVGKFVEVGLVLGKQSPPDSEAWLTLRYLHLLYVNCIFRSLKVNPRIACPTQVVVTDINGPLA